MSKETLHKSHSRASSSGFTLAELLLTMTIIGIIGSYTIPTLLQNLQNAETKVAFKRSFSDLSGVTQRLLSDNGGSFVGAFVDPGPGTIDDDMRDKYLNHMNSIKKCNDGADPGVCWHLPNYWTYFSGVQVSSDYTIMSRSILNNGSLLSFSVISADCTGSQGSLNTICGTIFIDVNSFRGPNKVGRDIFKVWVTANGLKSVGSNGDGDFTNCGGSAGGWGCATWALMNKSY